MLSKSLVPSALLLSITVLSVMTSAAQAAEVKVPFTGEVAKACEFIGEPVAGTLGGNDSILPTQLSSKAGKAGSVTVKCNTDATVYGQAPTVEGMKTSYGLGEKDAEKVSVKRGEETSIAVSLTLDSENPIPVGNYEYNVLITAAP